jgi:hypothetical protein
VTDGRRYLLMDAWCCCLLPLPLIVWSCNICSDLIGGETLRRFCEMSWRGSISSGTAVGSEARRALY